jgi:ectoine hydroxylase-related dioxygenase (phytanoyl-CoA dioxygenase family)
VSGTPQLKDLETKGYVVIPSFLSEAEIAEFRDDFARQPKAGHYNHSAASVGDAFKARIDGMLATVRGATNLHVDTQWGAIYFATGKGINFPWHQDHEAYFSFQNYYDYLNFYIPIVKPLREKSNLMVVPFDVMERECPAIHRVLFGHGSSRFVRLGSKRLVFCDDSGKVHLMPVDPERIADTPQLGAGDLLLLRGDIMHRTQDTETDRVSLSFRASSSKAIVRRSVVADGSLYKARMMAKNAGASQLIFKAFDSTQRDELEAHELLAAMKSVTPDQPRPRKEFMRYLLAQKRRSGVLGHFFPRVVVGALADRYASLYERFAPKAPTPNGVPHAGR